MINVRVGAGSASVPVVGARSTLEYPASVGEPKGHGWWTKPKLPRVERFVRRLAHRLETQFTPDERVDMAEARIQTHIRTTGADGGPAANARENLARSLEQADRWTGARVLREEVLAARRRHLGEENVQTLAAEVRLALNLSHDGLTAEALPLALHARDTYRQLNAVEQADLADQTVTSIRLAGGLGTD